MRETRDFQWRGFRPSMCVPASPHQIVPSDASVICVGSIVRRARACEVEARDVQAGENHRAGCDHVVPDIAVIVTLDATSGEPS